jgi:hypothetical protein
VYYRSCYASSALPVASTRAVKTRTREAIPQWAQTLAGRLADRGDEDALRNRVHHLP